MNNFAPYLVLVALGLPLVAYVWAAFQTPRERVGSLAGYFVAFRQVTGAPFANSSLAYAFQIATLFPFLYWGLTGQITPALVNAICWGVGILLFRRALPAVMSRVSSGSEPRTLHRILGDFYHSGLVLRSSAAVTILGMIGIALAEAYWGTQVLKVLVGNDLGAFYALVIGALLFVMAYVWHGGTWGSMKTDMLQLALSYIGFTGVFIFLIYKVFWAQAVSPAPGLGILAVVVVAAGASAIIVRITHRLRPVAAMTDDTGGKEDASPGDTSSPDGRSWDLLGRGLSLATFLALGFAVVAFAWVAIKTFSELSWEPLQSPGEPGWRGIFALVLLPLLFQFVDMSSWQRLQAIGGDAASAEKKARGGLLLYAVESPFSWLLSLGIGVLIASAFPALINDPDPAGPLATFPGALLHAGGALNVLVGFFFMVAVIGAMLSTIDSALLAAMYAYAADVKRFSFSPAPAGESSDTQERRDTLLTAKTSAFWLVLALIIGVMGLGAYLDNPATMIGVMVGFYGAMLALFPAVLFMLRQRQCGNGTAVGWSIIAGVAASLTFTIWGVFDPTRAWDAVFVGPGVALVVMLFALRSKPVRPDGEALNDRIS